PDLLHRSHVVSRELADISVCVRHRQKLAIPCRSAGRRAEIHFTGGKLHAGLAERHDQSPGGLMIAHRLPVLASLRARANLDWLAELHFENGGAISWRPGLRIDALPYVLLDHFLTAEISSVTAIELPQYTGFSRAHRELLIADIDQHTLKDFIQIERFA